jgi:hypothetical protein
MQSLPLLQQDLPHIFSFSSTSRLSTPSSHSVTWASFSIWCVVPWVYFFYVMTLLLIAIVLKYTFFLVEVSCHLFLWTANGLDVETFVLDMIENKLVIHFILVASVGQIGLLLIWMLVAIIGHMLNNFCNHIGYGGIDNSHYGKRTN